MSNRRLFTGSAKLCAYLFLAIASTALGTPQLARDTKLPCASCHSHVPRLNAFGQQFYSNGMRSGQIKLKMTLPVWGQAGSETVAAPGAKLATTYDDTAIVS